LDGLLLVVDPLNDHGNPHETVALPDDFRLNGDETNIQPFHHTYIGLDSLRQIEVMENSSHPRGGRFLDCGPGAGAILLYFGRGYDEAVGIDINSRAVKLSQFNTELNALENCQVFEDDALNLGDRYGRFDLVSWNLPFIFMPPEKGDNSIDAFGGELGIGLCLDFVERLPSLLTEKGLACIAAVAPILKGGENVLETKLKDKIGRLGLDCTVRVTQLYFANTSELWNFHRSFEIHRFESAYLFFTHGSGKLRHVDAPPARRAIDRFREKLYQRKFRNK
jgi:methylase of polypeptide subunit release factors